MISATYGNILILEQFQEKEGSLYLNLHPGGPHQTRGLQTPSTAGGPKYQAYQCDDFRL